MPLSKKAQVFTWDVVLATILFMVVLWIFLYLWADTLEDLANSETEYELSWLSTAVSEQLVRNPGVPYNWTKNPQPASITIMGLADTETIANSTTTLDRVLDADKVMHFINLTKESYPPIRNKLFGSGRYDFYVEFYCLDNYAFDCFENLKLETIDHGNITCENDVVFYIQNYSVWSDLQLAALWHFDETSGNIAHDGSGNANDGRVYGAIKASFTTSASQNSWVYVDLTSVPDYKIKNNDYLEYDVYWTLPGDRVAFDYTLDDGSALRNSGALDQNGTSASPEADLTTNALNKWYHRKISIDSHKGRTIQYYDIACENDENGVRTAYLDNILITNAGSVENVIYRGGAFTSAVHFQNHSSLSYIGSYASPTAWDSGGKFNGALRLDGLDDYVEVPSSDKLNLGVNQTISAWVTVGSLDPEPVRLVGKGDAAHRNYGLWLNPDSSVLFQIKGASVSCEFPVSAGVTIPDSDWHHIVATYNGSTGKIYLDGAEASSDECITTPYVTTDPLTIGYAGFDGHFNGSMDEVKILNRTLPAAEVGEEYAHHKKTCMVGKNTSLSWGMDDVAHDEKTVTFSREINSTILDENATLLEPTGIVKVVIYRAAELSTTTTTTVSSTTTTLPQITVFRVLPATPQQVGIPFTVTLHMEVNQNPGAASITERYPCPNPAECWVVSDISAGGTDNGGRIDWLFWEGGTPVQTQTITYKITAPSPGTEVFSGTVYYGVTDPITGDEEVIVT